MVKVINNTTKAENKAIRSQSNKAKHINKSKLCEEVKNKELVELKDTTNKLVKISPEDIYYSKVPDTTYDQTTKVSELIEVPRESTYNNSLDLVTYKKEITDHFIEIAKILASNGLKGAQSFNKSHEITQILEFKHMVDLAVESGILSKNTTVHIGTLSYKNAPDIILYTVENNIEKFITIQFKSLNAIISKKNIRALAQEYDNTDMIIINVKENFINYQLKRADKFELNYLNKIYFTTIDEEIMVKNHQWIINVLIYNLAKENIEYIRILDLYYRKNNKISETKPYDLWLPLSEEDLNRYSDSKDLDIYYISKDKEKELLTTELIYEGSSVCDSTRSSEIFVIKSQDTTTTTNLITQKVRSSREIRSNFVSVDNPDNKFASSWYTSYKRANIYKADNIPLTPGNILLGIATGYDKLGQ